MASFLKRHYLNDAKLAQRALLEFHRALASGRLVAFTGSLTTEPCGYGKWSDFVDTYGRLANAAHIAAKSRNPWAKMRKELDAIAAGTPETGPRDERIERFRAFFKALTPADAKNFDQRVVLGLFEEVLLDHEAALPVGMAHACGTWELDQAKATVDLLSIAMAHFFRKPYHPPPPDKPAPDVLGALLDGLGVRRIVTLNYDFELEGRLMLADQPGAEPPFERLRRLRANARRDLFDWQLVSGRIRRVMPNGQAVESDILNRERIDRMLEFAIGADDVDHHILHLHGRACSADTMIVSYRDYDKLYRRQGLSKLPFEYAQRILMGGNPVVFVGMGMSEGELNAALQDFVSSSPYQRVAPTFLLWNARTGSGKSDGAVTDTEMRRLDWLHRLGVLTIFDTDLGSSDAPVMDEPPTARLARLLTALPARAAAIGSREEYAGGAAWRQMRKAGDSERPVVVWEVAGESRRITGQEQDLCATAFASLAARIEREAWPAIGVIARQGSGKGSVSWLLAHGAQRLGIEPANAMLINGSFSFDTDNLLDAVARFLSSRTGGGYEDEDTGVAKKSRSAFFRSLADCVGPPLLIVINGCERFVSIQGEMLSAELNELFWMCANGKLPFVRLVLLGTARLRGYMRHKLKIPVIEGDEIGLPASWGEEMLPVQRFETIRAAFARAGITAARIVPGRIRQLELCNRHVRASAAARISGDLTELRRAFFDIYLDPRVLAQAVGQKKVHLATDVLRALGFIGLPVEATVLAHVPRLRQHGATEDALVPLLKRLEALGLVLRIIGHEGNEPTGKPPPQRFTLPRLLLTELRARFSVPLSESKLSAAFNMSLYVAQPVDGYIPEPEIHDELGMMVDRLLGAYRDMAREQKGLNHTDRRAELEAISAELMPHEDRAASHDVSDRRDLARELETLASPANMQCFRAALALIRGYYTTTDLLTLDVGDRLIREDRDPILLEHAERLDALIDAYGKIALAREALKRSFGAGFAASFGSVEPIYPDELVWLHNERGVIRLGMGDLYEARASFLRALDVNTRHVEREDRSHNWRRIRLNQLTVDIEGGELGLAQRKIEEILAVSTGTQAIGSAEEKLANALATGYRGWIHQLQGDEKKAGDDYTESLGLLGKLDEARAVAYFGRLRVTLAFNAAAEAGDGVHARVTEAMNIALATRQMDIVYRLRIVRAVAMLEDPASLPETRKAARRLLEDAQDYALKTDLNRVRVEAGIGMASARMRSGDYEGALRAVADAMMVATRYGMELRKIVLRSVMAMIMAERGHPITATHLAESAIRMGSRLRYAQAIRHAEQRLAEIPKISTITELAEATGRRSR